MNGHFIKNFYPEASLQFPRGKRGVYGIVNNGSGKIYIGAASCLSRRWSTHKCDLAKRRHRSRLLQDEFTNSPESFELVLIESVNSKTELHKREQFWMDFYRAYDPSHGYNQRPNADSNLGHKQKQEAKDKVSKANKGRKRTPEMCLAQALRQTGRKMPPKTEAYLKYCSERFKGRKPKPESISKARETRRKNKKGWCPVWQLDLSGNKIRRFDSVSEANRAMGRKAASVINQCFSGICKTAFGYRWEKAIP